MTINALPSPIHPGEVLLDDFMKPLGLTQYRLERYFGTSAEVWLRLQVRYDLETVQPELAERIQQEVKVLRQPA